jgi:polyribonucleotide nucleotidyltransferase
MDIKISGVTFDILRAALDQAREGRLFILDKMQGALSETRAELSPYAPRITSIQIDPDKIGTVIGKGGETIRALSEEYEAQIDVDDEGMVLVYATNGELGDAAIEAIRRMTKDVELGEVFTGKVVKTTTFGAFVELTKGTDGLIHISNLKPGERAESVEDVVNKGDELTVRVVELDKARGRIGLRLADDPAIEGKSVEELAAMGTGNGGRPRRDGDRGRGGRGRDRDRRGSRSRSD